MPITQDDIRKRAARWSEPISDSKPCGEDAKFDEKHERVRAEIAKLDSPTGLDMKWAIVLDSGTEILEEKSKDFLIATYVAAGLYKTRDLEGLLTGLAIIREYIDRYWTGMYPELKRVKARANVLDWYIKFVNRTLATAKVAPKDRELLEATEAFARDLFQVAREKFADNTPAFGQLTENLQRLIMTLPAAPAAPPPPPPPPPAQAAPEPSAQTAPAVAPPVLAPPPVVAPQPVVAPPPPVVQPAPSNGGAVVAQAPVVVAQAPAVALNLPTVAAATLGDSAQVQEFLRATGTGLISAANALRRADASDPMAYRMMRAGAWIGLASPPPADPTGKTKIPPPNPSTRNQLELLANNGKWVELLDIAEGAVPTGRFWLDLQRYVVQALGGLGASHARARSEVLRETGSLLKRMPVLSTLQFNDGTPLANPATVGWVEAEVMVGDGPGGEKKDPDAEALSEARKLAIGNKLPEAIALLQERVAVATSAAARFKVRLGLAQVCLTGNQLPLARALFESLERDVAAHSLEAWEPELASASAAGLLTCLRALSKAGKTPLPPEAGLLYDRLCRLDPAGALKIGA